MSAVALRGRQLLAASSSLALPRSLPSILPDVRLLVWLPLACLTGAHGRGLLDGSPPPSPPPPSSPPPLPYPFCVTRTCPVPACEFDNSNSWISKPHWVLGLGSVSHIGISNWITYTHQQLAPHPLLSCPPAPTPCTLNLMPPLPPIHHPPPPPYLQHAHHSHALPSPAF